MQMQPTYIYILLELPLVHIRNVGVYIDDYDTYAHYPQNVVLAQQKKKTTRVPSIRQSPRTIFFE